MSDEIWIQHDGSENAPVEPHTVVFCRMRYIKDTSGPLPAGAHPDWSHIDAYRIAGELEALSDEDLEALGQAQTERSIGPGEIQVQEQSEAREEASLRFAVSHLNLSIEINGVQSLALPAIRAIVNLA